MLHFQQKAMLSLQVMASSETDLSSRLSMALKMHWAGASMTGMDKGLIDINQTLFNEIRSGAPINTPISVAIRGLTQSEIKQYAQSFVWLWMECLVSEQSPYYPNNKIMENYFLRRYVEIKSGKTPTPIPNPAIVYHIFDVGRFSSGQKSIDLKGNVPLSLFGEYNSLKNYEDGLVSVNDLVFGFGVEAYNFIDGKGLVENAHFAGTFSGSSDSIDLYRSEQRLFRSLPKIIDFLRINGFGGPYGFKAAILGTRYRQVQLRKGGKLIVVGRQGYCQKNEIISDVIWFENSGMFEISSRNTFDKIWKEFGLPGSVSFSPQGRFVQDYNES